MIAVAVGVDADAAIGPFNLQCLPRFDGGSAAHRRPPGITHNGIAPGQNRGVVERGKELHLGGKPVAEGQAVPSATAPSLTAHGIILNGKPVRVGETLNPATGERTDLIAPGALHVGKPK